eukprot:TRINITY_DN66112_c9_g7_i1.p1 TRINITY_DN66112_c9_g7~~TRINITY_DN66112_c9_g7_i1.p1  ORF type:complete len:996 (+),score=611.06 TRINITY_DN66112_c9_g7_i1:224-3211(+)
MSEIRRTLSFSLVRDPKNLSKKPIEKHRFIYDASDMAVMHGNWHILAEMGGTAGVAASLRTRQKEGLYSDEVKKGDFAKRRETFGTNVIAKPPLKTFWEHCWENLQDPMLIILSIAGAISIVLGFIESPGSGWIEGCAILIAVVLVTVVASVNNMQQELAFRQLEDSVEEPQCFVIRDGERYRVGESKVVVGDLVQLRAGDSVPADGIIVAYEGGAACDESKMTGESDNIKKDFKHPFLLSGTEVTQGELTMIAVAVGPNSSYGRIMTSLIKPPEDTPLQEKLERVATLIGYLGGIVAILLFLVLTIWWAIDVADDGKDVASELHEVLDFFIIAVTVVVVAVPEGLPLAVTLSLAYSMAQMKEDNNLVRVLAACETMGNATCVCSDKTGTLTLNQMTVTEGWLAGTQYISAAPDVSDNKSDRRVLREEVIRAVIVNSQAGEEHNEETGQKTWVGSQTELALIRWLIKFGIDYEVERRRPEHEVQKNYPFDSKKKNSSIILKAPASAQGGAKYRRYYKGAAEQIFGRSNRVMDTKFAEKSLEEDRKEVLDTIDRMTRSGLRTIGFAYCDYDDIAADPDDPTSLADPEEADNLVFIGCVGIKDPLRPESRDSVRACQRAGIIVRMVTGDHLETAKFIARECGILTSPDHEAMTGEEFRKLMTHQEEAEEVIPRLRVLARSKPEDKATLVNWLKDHGHVVSATGDGTNDAPALKAADVGLAMNSGTTVAKSAAEIVILDDNFASIVKAVMWGRSVFDNIRKFVQFQLTVNVVALLITLIGAFTKFTNPLKAVQLLWVNLIMDTMAALALGTEKPTLSLLDRRPYSKDAPLISQIMWRNILSQSVLQLVALLVILYAGFDIWDVEKKSIRHFTLVFNAFVFLQIFNEINSRKVNLEKNVFKGFFANHMFASIILITVFFQALMVQLFGDFAETEGLNAVEWFSTIGIGALSLPWGFATRFIHVDAEDGMITIPKDTFKGANLDKSEDDAARMPHADSNV